MSYLRFSIVLPHLKFATLALPLSTSREGEACKRTWGEPRIKHDNK